MRNTLNHETGKIFNRENFSPMVFLFSMIVYEVYVYVIIFAVGSSKAADKSNLFTHQSEEAESGRGL